MIKVTKETLIEENAELRARLEELQQLIDAIKAGEVDAFAINNEDKAEVFTLRSGDFAYRLLVEELEEGAVNVTEDGLIVYTNPYFHKLLNRPYEQVVGQNFFDFVHPGSRLVFEALFSESISGKSKGEIELAVDGNVIPVYVSMKSLQPSLSTVGIILTNLTEKKNNDRIKASEKSFRELANSMPQVVWVANSNGDIIYYNDQVTRFSEVTQTSADIWDWHTIIHPDDLSSTLALWQMALETGAPYESQHRLKMNDDSYRWHLTRGFAQKDDAGNIVQWYGTATDIHEYKMALEKIEQNEARLEQMVKERTAELENANEGLNNSKEQLLSTTRQLVENNLQLERTNDELESFNYIASHDLQEPLRKIQTFLGLLLEQKDDTQALNRYVDKSIQSANRMRTLIDAVLNYSRLSKTKLDELRPTDLNEVLRDVKIDLELQIQEKRAVIVSQPLPIILARPLLMQQLFSNLITNSLKFSMLNPKIEILCSIVKGTDIPYSHVPHSIPDRQDIDSIEKNGHSLNSADKKFAEIVFSDNGIGFDPQYAKKIFELFQRLHGKAEYGGTGIGLSIAKKIVDQHKGYIYATGAPNRGAVFTVYLPVG